uniref:Uncharacterized protein n=1 Tax=Strongyloides papillosus TaxID=174720 RepID=A0A0N5BSR2_STREA
MSKIKKDAIKPRNEKLLSHNNIKNSSELPSVKETMKENIAAQHDSNEKEVTNPDKQTLLKAKKSSSNKSKIKGNSTEKSKENKNQSSKKTNKTQSSKKKSKSQSSKKQTASYNSRQDILKAQLQNFQLQNSINNDGGAFDKKIKISGSLKEKKDSSVKKNNKSSSKKKKCQ